MRNSSLQAFWLSAFLLWGLFSMASAQSLRSKEKLPPAPESRVYDPDKLYRSQPEALARISESLKKLKAEHDFDVYLVVYSGLIGKDSFQLANNYHEAWLDPKNDGLVFVMDVQAGNGGGTTGRSTKLYQGDFIEEGVMPRMLIADIEVIANDSSKEMEQADDVVLKIDLFIQGVAGRISEQLGIDAQLNPLKEDVNFMGIMAIGLLLVGLLIAIASKLLGRADQKAARLYRFPDVLVGERLGAPNGGGKVSWTDYGSPSER